MTNPELVVAGLSAGVAGYSAMLRNATNAVRMGNNRTYGRFKSQIKWTNQLNKRGWTEKQITEAIRKGKQYKAVNNVNKANFATINIHTKTGQSVVIDNVTNELLHVGGTWV